VVCRIRELDLPRGSNRDRIGSNQAGRVVHILHSTPSGAPVFTPDTPLAAEMSGLEPRDGEKVFTKNHPSSFAGTGLHEFLKERSVNKVVLCGYMAHVCVSTTARAAAELGYDVVLARDAIGDRDIPGMTGDEVAKVSDIDLRAGV
jgi:nicotinamidase-related amidase